MSDDFLKKLCPQHLPNNIQTVLAEIGDKLDKLAEFADKVSEIGVPRNDTTIEAIFESNKIKILRLQISERSKNPNALTAS